MGKVSDLTNQQFGRLLVFEKDIEESKKRGRSYWKCQCQCGNIKTVRGTSLICGDTQSCGCLAKEVSSQVHKIDYSGQKYNYITALYPTDKKYDSSIIWMCQCECGKQLEVPSHLIKITKSCGCKTSELLSKANSRDLTGQVFGRLTAKYKTGKKLHSKNVWYCECSCGNSAEVITTSLVGGDTQSCGCISSKGEMYIEKVLKDNHILYEKQKIFADFVYNDTKAHPRYDFYLPDYNRLIEFDGEQHFKNKGWNRDLSQQKERDAIKNNYALFHNISLVRIPYWERDNITLDLILGDKYLLKEAF